MRFFLMMCASLSLCLVGCGEETSDPMPTDPSTPAGGSMTGGSPMMDGGSMDGGSMDGGSMDVPMVTAEAVQAIFDTKCLSCHGTSGQLALDDFESKTLNVESTVAGLTLIVPGDHQASYLWHKVNGSHTSVGGNGSTMPLGTPLTADEVTAIANYIDGLE